MMMMKVCILIGVVLALSSAHPTRFDSELDESWLMYKKQHNKQYEGKDEVLRRVIWESNVKYIQKHNIEYDMGKHTFSLGINEYADMTLKEFTTKMFGYKMTNGTGGALYLPPSNAQELPETVDWRTKGYVTPVKNQGQCGSCWAFSATGSLEGQHFKKTGKLVSLSEQNLVDCSKAEGNQGCQGGLMDDAFNYIKKAGIDTESSYPYKGENGQCKFQAANVGATVTGFVDIKKENEADLQKAVATVGPVSVAIDANHITFQLYSKGVYTNLLCSQTRLDHGVLAVGYGTDEGKAYWMVKNSWGASWGIKGYIMMARNHNNMCGISTSASYPTV